MENIDKKITTVDDKGKVVTTTTVVTTTSSKKKPETTTTTTTTTTTKPKLSDSTKPINDQINKSADEIDNFVNKELNKYGNELLDKKKKLNKDADDDVKAAVSSLVKPINDLTTKYKNDLTKCCLDSLTNSLNDITLESPDDATTTTLFRKVTKPINEIIIDSQNDITDKITDLLATKRANTVPDAKFNIKKEIESCIDPVCKIITKTTTKVVKTASGTITTTTVEVIKTITKKKPTPTPTPTENEPTKTTTTTTSTTTINSIDDYTFNPKTVLISGTDGSVTSSTITTDELGSLSGITSSLKSQIDNLSKRALPTGVIGCLTSSNIPDGWLLCDGRPVPSENTKLIDLIGYFTPDLRGVFLRGLDTANKFDQARKIGSLQNDDIRSHTHWCSGAPKDDLNSSGCGNNNQCYGLWADAPSYSVNDPNFSFGRYVAYAGGKESRPINVAVNYIIKAN